MSTFSTSMSGGIVFGGVPYRYRRKLTIPAGTCKTITGFPLLVQVTLGVNKVRNESFMMTDINNNPLPFELRSFDLDRGKVTGYARVNTSYTSDVSLYLYYA